MRTASPLIDVLFLAGVYRRAAFPHRLHLMIRRVTCPFDKVVDAVPMGDGLHADVGCGHGILLALLRRRRAEGLLLGLDIDRAKIRQAKSVLMDGIDFRCGTVDELQPGSVDSISVVDVLYLMPEPVKVGFLRACARALKPGGTLVVKALVCTPGWKHRVIRLQEYAMVRVFRITKGETVNIPPPGALAALIRNAGFTEPEVTRLDRGYPYPHSLFVCRRVANEGEPQA